MKNVHLRRVLNSLVIVSTVGFYTNQTYFSPPPKLSSLAQNGRMILSVCHHPNSDSEVLNAATKLQTLETSQFMSLLREGTIYNYQLSERLPASHKRFYERTLCELLKGGQYEEYELKNILRPLFNPPVVALGYIPYTPLDIAG
jgi:hypothetical protein